jgi:hypothetical protein
MKKIGISHRKIVTVITDALGDRVNVGEKELDHSLEGHFVGLPQDIFLELLERVLKDPSEVYRDDRKKEQIFNFFYRLDKGQKFILAIIKLTPDGAFFSSMYPTGKKIRNTHRKFKKVKL